jgi:HipA-like protein
VGPMADELVVVLAGRQIGTLAQGMGGVLTLTYTEEWSTAATAMPFSLPIGA